jgi:hypothetical protein
MQDTNQPLRIRILRGAYFLTVIVVTSLATNAYFDKQHGYIHTFTSDK